MSSKTAPVVFALQALSTSAGNASPAPSALLSTAQHANKTQLPALNLTHSSTLQEPPAFASTASQITLEHAGRLALQILK